MSPYGTLPGPEAGRHRTASGEATITGSEGQGRPLVSAIIPAYGRPRRTQRAVDSVAGQTYRPLELIVVDDGSSPPLAAGLELVGETLERVRVIRHERNRGANVARKTGIEAASGDYLAFLDSDDEWLPEKIERQVERLEASDRFEASYTGVKQVDARGRLNAVNRPGRAGDLLDDLLRGDVIGSYSLVVVSRSALGVAGPPDPEMPCWQDWEWYLRLAAAGVAFDAVEEPLAVKHHEGEQLGRDYELRRDRGYPIMRRRIRELAETGREARVGIAHLNHQLGYTALKNLRYGEARRHFLEAIRAHPLEPEFYLHLSLAGPHYPWLRGLKRSAVRLSR